MTPTLTPVPILCSISEIVHQYDAWLCDVWGVIHNGERAYSGAVTACQKFRSGGGRVVLITNSPRPWTSVQPQLDQIGVPRDCYDAIVTSGDVTRILISTASGREIYHLGPERDLAIFDGLDVHLTEPENAHLVLCSGLFDDTTETPEDYTELFDRLLNLNLPMICANPDHVVERGAQIIYCAGALADAYERRGGKVRYAGKPHLPIYDIALATIRDMDPERFDVKRVVAIGDGLKTDMAGARSAGLDALFVASGIHVEGHDDDAVLSGAVIASLFSKLGFQPVAAQGRLRW